jgi:hypothetical protein
MVTIRGAHISLVRPSFSPKPHVRKVERPYARNQAKTKTVKEHCGRVVDLVVEADGWVYSLAALPGLSHDDVIDAFDLTDSATVRVGWRLKTGKEVWR